ncbi:putative bifunctional diguanylate cyclase/phosphodiesterase [Amaricoccus tamworthensis]|uniref:putative bifunctional diguanylate cyclase/phosphodiesterase n=1 Tax=Amaricoccus tamworthensis TaxID=57002 RepID=UPI003C7C381C
MRRIGGTRTKFACFGVLFGLMFPLCGFAFERYWIGTEFDTPLYLIRQNPIHGIVAIAPLVLGGVFLFLGHMQANLRSEMRKSRTMQRELWGVLYQDELTGIGNRNSLKRDIEALIDKRAPAVLLVIDLDRFKPINDTLGHQVGDELLKAAVRRISRELDKGSKIYRVGGDEFAVLTPGQGSWFINDLAKRISSSMDRPLEACGAQVVSGCSIGITSLVEGDTERSDLLARASFALQQARAPGGGGICYFSQTMSEDANSKLRMESEIRRGLAENEFFLEFQPIVNMQSNMVRGFEALVRWQHPELGRIPPNEFIPLAELSGLIGALGEHVLEMACRAAAQWPSPASVSVNVSMEQFKNPQFVEKVEDALDRNGLPPGRLVLEITETVFSLETEMLQTVLRRLKMMGVRFALDDFGTGYSSINHLRQFDLDYLKLDKSFADSLADQRERDLVRTIVNLGQRFSLTTTIEGVESSRQLAFMRENGVDEVQGFLVSKPLPSEDVMNFLSHSSHGVAGMLTPDRTASGQTGG